MRNLSRMLLAAVAAALALPALAAAAPAATATRGVVVQRDAKAGAVVVATRSGALQRVKLAKPNRLAMGSLVKVSGSKVSLVGHARRAKVRGVVVHRGRHSYALAGNGSVIAVATATPPRAGEQITATVQVSPTALSDDDGEVQVNDTRAPGAEVRGTVLAQDAKTLQLAVDGFPSGLSIALGEQTIPALAAGTPVEARVALGPDPANPGGIVLTLVALHVENGDHGDGHGAFVRAEGQVTDLTEAGPSGGATGSITITGEHGAVTFTIPAGFGATGVALGDQVEAKGTAATIPGDNPALVRLEGNHSGSGDSQGDSGDGGDGSGGDD